MTFVGIPLIMIFVLVINDQFLAIPSAAIGVLFGLLTLVPIAFSSMTIEVNESEITWYFGRVYSKRAYRWKKLAAAKK